MASHVKALFTTREGGVSKAPWASFNLGDHVGDDPLQVGRNRQLLAHHLSARPVFLQQVHAWDVCDVHADSPDGNMAYVAVENDSLLAAIDMQKLTVKATLAVGARTNGLTMHPNGKWLFASNGGDANVAVVDTDTFTVRTHVPVGQRPWNMAITPDGNKLYVAAGRSHAVSVIDTQTFVPLNAIPVGKLPWGAAAN